MKENIEKKKLDDEEHEKKKIAKQSQQSDNDKKKQELAARKQALEDRKKLTASPDLKSSLNIDVSQTTKDKTKSALHTSPTSSSVRKVRELDGPLSTPRKTRDSSYRAESESSK